MEGIPISPEAALPVPAVPAVAERAAFKESMPIAGAAKEAASIGAVSPNIIGGIANTAFLVGGVLLAYWGMKAVVTGKNPLKKTA